ncbi:MAG: acireductone synthase [Alphaproteobacteria bacterium]|nr:acireductone synthase [Alphaproteobacteria bacterium]
MNLAAILLDIEGTTSSVSFVYDVLFPDARRQLAGYVAAQEAEVAPILDEVRSEAGQPGLTAAECADVLLRWMDEDRKAAPLKALQGMIWRDGYAAGRYRGHVFPDVAPALRRWAGRGLAIYIYSSGSVEAQKLLFGHSAAGDLTPLLSGHFDTRTGGKKEPSSYAAIARAVGLPPARILFLSDNPEELDAARAAGLRILGSIRPGNTYDLAAFPSVCAFDEVDEALAGTA